MLLKRMRHTTAAKERLKELHEQHRELEEQMLAVFSEVLEHTLDIPDDEDATLGHSVRRCCMGAPKRCGNSTSRCRRTIMITTGPSCGVFIARIAWNSSGYPTC